MLYLITVPNINTLTYSFESSLVTLALTLSFELITEWVVQCWNPPR